MEDKNLHVLDLPDNWWQSLEACVDFANFYQQHTLGLLFAHHRPEGLKIEVYSGLKVFYQGLVLWLTAGHVIKSLNNAVNQFNDQINVMMWLDHASTPEASAFIAHNRNFERHFVYSESEGVDLGFGILTGLDAANILNNPNALLISDLKTNLSNHITPEGYYLIGYPNELGEFTQEAYKDTKVLNKFFNSLICLPLQHLRDMDDDWLPSFKRNDVFIGQLLDYSSGKQQRIESVKGMSGGPVFAITRHPSNRFVYELVGIQSGWLKQSRIIRVESISKVVKFVEDKLTT